VWTHEATDGKTRSEREVGAGGEEEGGEGDEEEREKEESTVAGEDAETERARPSLESTSGSLYLPHPFFVWWLR
jgi:hypothetical protein